jgi:hypothetical protein
MVDYVKELGEQGILDDHVENLDEVWRNPFHMPPVNLGLSLSTAC